MRYFLALARQGSLSAVARSLRVNHATVARRIASLEETLGRQLFDRRSDGYALTADGRAILDEAEAMDEAALSVLRRLDRGSALRGLVRVTTPRVLADGFLVSRLASLSERHPEIEIELIADSRSMSLARREADVALRFGRPADGLVVARKLGVITFDFYAAPAYADRLQAGEPPKFIGYDEGGSAIAEAAWLTRRFPNASFAFRSNSQIAQAIAARAGFGVALLPPYLVVEAGLRRMELGETPPPRELWLLIRPDLAKEPRVRAVADHLAALVKTNRRLLAGEPPADQSAAQET